MRGDGEPGSRSSCGREGRLATAAGPEERSGRGGGGGGGEEDPREAEAELLQDLGTSGGWQ